jgi:hypothetical protein
MERLWAMTIAAANVTVAITKPLTARRSVGPKRITHNRTMCVRSESRAAPVHPEGVSRTP